MAITTINVGTTPNDGTGDSLRTSFTICNNNFSYLESIISGNGIVSANSLIVSGNVLLGESLSFTPPGAALQYGGTANSYVQMVIQNKSSLTNASSDYVVTADNGDDANYFGDFGIASSTYLYEGFESILPNDTYVLANGGNLLLNAGSADKSVKFVVGGSGTGDIVGQFSNTALSINPTTISTSTTSGALQVGGGAGIGGNAYIGSAVIAGGGAVIAGEFTGAYTTGIVLDTASGNSRISVAANTGLTIYNNGIAGNRLLSISNIGDVAIHANTVSSSATTGALVVSGGVGITGNVFLNGNITISATDATLSSPSGVSLSNIRAVSYNGFSSFGTNTTALTANITAGFASKVGVQINSNITIDYGTINPGYEKYFYIKNVSPSTANIILPNSNNNKGTNVIPVNAGTIASVTLIAPDATAANVVAIIVNN